MDLSPLRIDRSSAPATPSRGGRRRSSGRTALVIWLVLLLIVAGGVYAFRAPLFAWIDRMRLQEVEVVVAMRTSPNSAGAIEGTAANGYVVADRRAALSADTPGRVVELNVREGSFVKEGEVVARLYSDEYRAALARAEAELQAHAKTMARAQSDVAVAEADVALQKTSIDAARANLESADATLKQATQKLERAERMVADNIETQQWLDDARAEHERVLGARNNAQALLQTAQAGATESTRRVEAANSAMAEALAQLPALAAARDLAKATFDKTEVRAPFTGIVVLKDAEVGEVVSPNAQGTQSRGSIATMVDFESLQVQVEMPERNITAVEVGSPVRIFLDAFPDKPYAGKVERVWPVANRQKATIEVRARFDQLDERLRPEMGVRVVFLPKGAGDPKAAGATSATKLADGVFVHENCVVREGGRTYVFKVERGVARAVDLTLKEPRNGRYFVEQGLAGGERLVVNPSSRLADGDRVHVKE